MTSRRLARLLRGLFLGGLLASAVGCGKTVPAPKAAPAPPNDEAIDEPPLASEAPGPSAPAPAGEPGEPTAINLRWSRQATPFTGGLVVGEAHVAAISDDRVRLLARRTGRVAAELELADVVPGGLAFEGDSGVVAVCKGRLERRSLTPATPPVTVPFATTALRAAFGATRFAVAYEDGVVRVYDRASLDPQRELRVDADVATLALTETRLAIGLESGDLALLDLETGDVMRHRVAIARGVDVLVPSADGRLFVGAGPKVGIWSDTEARLSPRLRNVGGILAAGWLQDGTVATIGRDGLLVIDPATGGIRSLGGGITGTMRGEALAVDLAGRRLCVAEAGGRVSCYGPGGAATRQIANPTPGRVGQSTATATVVERYKRRLVVHAQPGMPLPAKDDLVRLYRFREVTIGKVRSGRWIDTTEGKVRNVSGPRIEVRIGKVRNADGIEDPLLAGLPVELVWTPAPKVAPKPETPGKPGSKKGAKKGSSEEPARPDPKAPESPAAE